MTVDVGCSHMEHSGYGRTVTREITLGSFGNSFSTPGNEDEFRQCGIGIFDFDKSKLDFAIREFVDEVG